MYTKILCAISLLAATPLLRANTTYLVTNTDDNGGTNPAAHAGTGTLRQAIVDSNADGGAQNIIQFDIPGSGPFTIAVTPGKRLPVITSNLGIDGFSQPGAAANTNTPDMGGLNSQLMIEIDGGNANDYGLFAGGSGFNVSVAGVVIDGFTSAAIEESGNDSLLVFGCYVGTQFDGTAFPSGYGNNGIGVRVDVGQANIGGVLPGQRNLISGNAAGNILIASDTATVEGNLIGIDASGTLAIGGGISSNWPGVVLSGNFPNVRIGCTGAGCTQAGAASRNVISGHHTYGIGLWGGNGTGSGGVQIKGNFIGTDWSGTRPLPNGNCSAGSPAFCGGIQLQGSSTTATPASVIGGFNPGEGNLIAYNNGYGIAGYEGTIGASFDNQGNAIHNNRGTDIAFDLNVGRVANDAGDADSGTNDQQNYPVIQSASVSGTPENLVLNVTYLVDSAPTNSVYPLRIDFYVDIDGGSGEYLVSDSYPAASAQLVRTVSLPLPADAQSPSGIVATATDANGYTSEFSADFVFDRIFADGFGH